MGKVRENRSSRHNHLSQHHLSRRGRRAIYLPMAQDPYQTLGLSKTASQDEIRKAFRNLAKKHHPDLNPGNAAAEARFKAASSAHDLLSDPDTRAKFDRGEIDAEGKPSERAFYRQYAEGEQGARYRRPGAGAAAGDDGFADVFAEMFRNGQSPFGGQGQGGARQARGQDRQYSLTVSFLEAAAGANRRLSLPEGRTLDVVIPPGLQDGQTLRLRGQGDAGWNGGPAGDALIEISVAPHPFFRREGDDLHLDLPVTIAEAVLGAKVPVPTLTGTVQLTIPPHSDAGKRMRLRGRGIPAHGSRAAGDLYATLTLIVGAKPDAALEAALKTWAEAEHPDPRAALAASMVDFA
jgi:DnaJ-class molecular chaperone